MTFAIRVIAESKVLDEILAEAKITDDIEAISEKSVLDPKSVLNAGINPEDLKTALELAILVFKYGTAVAVFAKSVRDLLVSEKSKEKVTLSDPKTGEKIAEIRAETSDAELEKLDEQ